MKYRLSACVLAYPFDAKHLRAGTPKDACLSDSDGFTLDRVDDTLFISHAGSSLRKCVPWDAVTDSTVAPKQPAWSDWADLEVMLYANEAAPAPKPVAMGGAFPGQRVDGRSREARALKQGQQ